MDTIVTAMARGPLRWGQRRNGFYNSLPVNLGAAAFGYGCVLSGFMFLFVVALRGAGT